MVGNVLSPSGVMIMNIITANDKDTRADGIALAAQAIRKDVVLFDWPRQKDRNTLIVGGMTERTHIPSGKEPAEIKRDLRGIIRRKPRVHASY
jgi:hypothetical protein